MKLFFSVQLGHLKLSGYGPLGRSHPNKQFGTGLRIVGSFLKVKLHYNICGPQMPLTLPEGRG